jgi:hypothetical protein
MGEKIMAEMSDFQKSFLSKGTGNKLFTQEEFDGELQAAQAEIVAMAISATREAVRIEREACIKIIEDYSDGVNDPFNVCKPLIEMIRNRVQAKVE